MDGLFRFAVPLRRFLPTSPTDAADMEMQNWPALASSPEVPTSELEYQLLLARDLKLLQPNDYETLSRQTVADG